MNKLTTFFLLLLLLFVFGCVQKPQASEGSDEPQSTVDDLEQDLIGIEDDLVLDTLNDTSTTLDDLEELEY